MNVVAAIESAQLMFRQILEDFFTTVYDEKNLSSHGIDHHRRVWVYAKELLSIPLAEYNSEPTCSPSKLVIACYLHDIGMSVDHGPRHGKHSRDICMLFLEKNNLNENDYKDVLDTIENHDRKDYTSKKVRNDLLTVLSVADDLDAIGFAGIYRFSEIYLTRGVIPQQAGQLILENAGKRFANFEKNFSPHNHFVQSHRKRFEILKNFFIQYNKQADSYDFRKDEPEGYCGVMQLIMMLIREKMTPKDFFIEAGKYGDDTVIRSFLNGLKSELSLKDQAQ
jgi:hypothetical protein